MYEGTFHGIKLGISSVIIRLPPAEVAISTLLGGVSAGKDSDIYDILMKNMIAI